MSLKTKIGCQTYTWEMLGKKWKGDVDDILDTIASVGYEGIEVSHNMIGRYFEDPDSFRKALRKRDLTLAAFAYASPQGFSKPEYWQKEFEEAKHALEFTQGFPRCVLGLGGAAHTNSEENRMAKLSNACRLYNEIGKLGKEMGIMVAFHPHSHHGSLIEKTEDYKQLMTQTVPNIVSWNPDTGHIIRGGEDLLELLGKYRSRIKHVHLKDTTKEGKWMPLGKGICNFTKVFELLEEIDYSGWIILEEESDEAERNILGTISNNLAYVRSLIK